MRVFTWNDKVHEARRGARLQFWRFAFAPHYDRQLILAAIETILGEQKITSYIVYEAFGSFDILLRLWVPRNTTPEDLGLEFDARLEALSCYQQEYTLVQATALHWVWGDIETSGRREPSPDDLLEVTNSKVVELSDFNDRVQRAHADLRNPEPADLEWLTDFEKRNLISAVPLDRHGVRFYVRFDHSVRPLRKADREVISRQIREKCLKVSLEAQARHHLVDPIPMSCYVGTGPMTDFLIMAKAPDQHFYSFARDLFFELHSLDLHKQWGMRTYTEVLADRNFAKFCELPLTEQTQTTADILMSPESETLEFKATLGFDVRRFLNTGERHSSKTVSDSIVKAVCGLLNSPSGGRLVIGALELERELERARDRDGILAKLQAEYSFFPSFQQGERPAPETKVIIGIEEDFSEWDRFVLKLEEIVRNQITPSPSGFFDVQPPLEITGRKLAVVVVRPSPTNWFYATIKDAPEFYVRELASTRAYFGPDVDLYRAANPRGVF